MSISITNISDMAAMVRLMNQAYRGEASRAGWTTEADLVGGELRTDEAHIRELMAQPATCFLKYENAAGEMEGCVYLQNREGKLYLGMLSVLPSSQAKGIGKQLMLAAEEQARKMNCRSVFMRVIDGRDSLIGWYERQGYRRTGETQPWEDNRFGFAKVPLLFIVLEKPMKFSASEINP